MASGLWVPRSAVDEESDRIRDVYAHFGLALYETQVLEEALTNLLVALRLPRRDETTRSDIDALREWAQDQTLGQLLRRVQSEFPFEPAVAERLAGALTDRNLLAHGYFAERAAAFCTSAGCEAMIAELSAVRDRVDAAVTEIERVFRPLLQSAGITDQHIAQQAQRMIGEAYHVA